MLQVDDVLSAGKFGSLAASPISVLDPSMANWSWDSTTPLVSQHGSPLRGSPLRSCSSPSSDATHNQEHVSQEPLFGSMRGRGGAMETSTPARTRPLVEALKNCLTSLPHSTHTGDRAGLSSNNPSGATPTTSRSGGSTSNPLGPTKPASKRRSRASRRTPTTVLETNPSEFRDTVQRLTGIPSMPNQNTAPVRPQPKRPNPGTFLRPDALRSIRRLPPISSPPPLLNPFMNGRVPSMNPATHISFLQHLQRIASEQVMPQLPKREPEGSIPLTFFESDGTDPSLVMPVPSMPSEQWWTDPDSSGIISNPRSPRSRLNDNFAERSMTSESMSLDYFTKFADQSPTVPMTLEDPSDNFVENWLCSQDYSAGENQSCA
ncbi:uncharacterized protein [Physcomitrium patens]|uniref:VQ domain-containing protein n=1 Tax=Physcomitrium patens TaxID=3218 RepID=A9T1P6_PHYPA|nr:uncharacterized protein LOC112273560 [Physcomitrium patens]PNR32604.1 hypothetical protein PHYPA_024546 [Physcomitrium patens]|eukprot:XP_024358253.1 uncharacterized protein LOC112273560 [Physcomitrella patens]